MAAGRSNIFKRLLWEVPGTILKAGAKDTATVGKAAAAGVVLTGVAANEAGHIAADITEGVVKNRWKIVGKGAKILGKGIKWGGIATGVAAGGGLLYAAFRPSGRSETDGQLNKLQDQLAENSAKLEAMQSMTPQPAVMQSPTMVMANPQGVQAGGYPTTLLVPANANNIPTTAIASGAQYQGPLASSPGMQMGTSV